MVLCAGPGVFKKNGATLIFLYDKPLQRLLEWLPRPNNIRERSNSVSVKAYHGLSRPDIIMPYIKTVRFLEPLYDNEEESILLLAGQSTDVYLMYMPDGAIEYTHCPF